MYNGARTFALPPQTIRLPLKEPLSLLRGATPTRSLSEDSFLETKTATQ